jgi:hypothetical protein
MQERLSQGEKQARELKRQQEEHRAHEALATQNRTNRVNTEQQRKMDGVAKVRQEKQYLRKDLVDQRQQQMEMNKARRQQIKEADERQKKDRARAAARQTKLNKKEYDRKVLATEREIQEKVDSVRKMEQEELALIKSLKAAQVLQKDAFVVLEGALANT